MDLLNNIGLSYKGDYISQGSVVDRLKKSTELGTKYTEFIIRNDGKDTTFEKISNLYSGKVIFHMPTININQTNLKEIKDKLNELSKNDFYLITIDASTLLYETFDWSTDEEQQNYLKNMASGIASLVNTIPIAIENTKLEKNNLLFGKTVSNMSALLVYTRNELVDKYNFTREKANKMVGLSLNVGNIIKTNDIVDLDNWIKIFYNDIKCIKIRNIDSNLDIFNKLLDLVISNNIDVPILVELKDEIENITNSYKKFEYLINSKLKGLEFNLNNYQNIVTKNEVNNNFSSSQSGYTTAIIIVMILLTAIISVLMIMVRFNR